VVGYSLELLGGRINMKNKNLASLQQALTKKEKIVVMLAPSFIADFDYPEIIYQLRSLGFDKVVELTFGAKMINREYHRILEENEKSDKKELIISSVCPGIVNFVKTRYPQYNKNIIRVDSPMVATAKITKKVYPKHKICFISPCNFKKSEVKESGIIDYVIDYSELGELLKDIKTNSKKAESFDKFYNDYTKVYPLSGGLSKTAHLKGVLKPGEEKIIDGILEVEKFLKNPDKKIKFLDVTFCKGGCIGGPFVKSHDLVENKRKVLKYCEHCEKEKIPKSKEGLIEKAEGIKFTY
jgi:iron only hydrogenase large subunit-like protein